MFKNRPRIVIAVGVCIILLATAIPAQTPEVNAQTNQSDWTMAGKNPQRTGYTAENISKFSTLRWQKTFEYENIATVAQVVTGNGNAYIGTLGRDDLTGTRGGKVYALNPTNGNIVWNYSNIKGGIAHTLSFANGAVYGATTAGEVFSLDAATGQQRWQVETGFGGFTVNPLILDNTMLLGSRDGNFYAFNLDGTVKWTKNIGVPIVNSAAGDNGVVYFLDESMAAHALSIANGTHLAGWPNRTAILGGTARDYWPVIAGDYVVFRTAPAHEYNWAEIETAMGITRTPANIDLPLCPDPNTELINFLNTDAGKYSQTLFVLNKNTGAKVATTAGTHVGGSGQVSPPPVLDASGNIIVEYRTKCSMWDSTSWVNNFSAMGTLNPTNGHITQIVPATTNPWGSFWIIPDESATFIVAGNKLLNSHQGNIGVFDLTTKKASNGYGQRDTYGGFAPATWARQEWHGGPRAPLTVSNGVIYFNTGGRIIAINAN